MTVYRKLVAGFAIVIVLMAAVMAYMLGELFSVSRSSEEAFGADVRAIETAKRLDAALLEQESIIQKYLVSADTAYYQAFAVHIPILKKFGGECELEMSSRGFYPEGGGEVVAEIAPIGGLSKVDLGSQGRTIRVERVAYAQNLPEHVVSRMKHSALKKRLDFKEVRIESDLRNGPSTGAGMVLSVICEDAIFGESALGAKGVRSETLGEGCAEDLLETLRSKVTVDDHMLDQVLLYMAVAEKGSRIIAQELTGHAETNIWVIEQFLGKKFSVTRTGGLTEVRATSRTCWAWAAPSRWFSRRSRRPAAPQ